MNNLLLCPKIVHYNIMLNLQLKDLLNLGQVNKKFNYLINENYLWELKINKDFSEKPKMLINSFDYKFVYETFYEYKQLTKCFIFDDNVMNDDLCLYYETSIIIPNWSDEKIISRLLTLFNMTNKVEFESDEKYLYINKRRSPWVLHGIYFSNEYRHSFHLIYRRGMKFQHPHTLNVSDRNIYTDKLKKIICLTQPTFYNKWTAIDEQNSLNYSDINK